MEALYVRYLIPLKNYLMLDCLGGPRPLQLRYVVNLQKGGTFPVMLCLMYYFDNWSMAACLYTANHGSYGLVWLLKDLILPDKAWTPYITIPSTIVTALVLVGYWGAGYIVIAHRVDVAPGLTCLCTTMNILGTVLMIGADTQKDGWLTWSRNTNYLGEMLLYLSFALWARHWFPFAVLGCVWSILFLSNMTAKELSFCKKEGGPAYMARTGFLFPNVMGWWTHFMARTPKTRTS
ncbi:hypothetical protein SPRG_08101 [Saprolegnia parasitica CBS 223.65]|uniref:Steroid 5-alpha reductase C-terminal domain-containing protein n=1 Tax=Saprolegnia parasitica (strain CBS 223.65) TaxID=695850 RepID=A0A067CJV1_SAPPC|nr:hypothetical protein SPRG_08101 [Saprolegnia parasitica CBS 223.65]KDO26811.1 hypothetical protein SPRG_08101 [Saprolegnia parasitica CBS 223.65]|eukprot:XP_012202459.1 hypothetical protein SPRG_08101 [Saprolegnia parasitica CBS 223.65]